MPPEAISLALAASIYPPAVAAVIALGRGTDVRLRVLLLVAAALMTVFITGSLMLLLFQELGVSSHAQRTVSAWLYVAGGVALLALALRLRGRPATPRKPSGDSRTTRYLESRRLVVLLGVVLYVVPSPIYVGAVKAIADTHASAPQELAYLAALVVIMLWMVEIPMLALLGFPRQGSAALERINGWFSRHGRALGVLASAAAGAYLLAVGLIEAL